MIRRGFAAVIVATLFLAQFPVANAATAKAGAPCTKLKATSVVNGKKYTCIKSGKKLIWDKGVTVKITTPKPTAKPTPSALAINCLNLDLADKDGITQKRADALLGMSEIQALECAESLQWGFRVGQRDSEAFPMTLDYRLDRVTVIVKLGVITRVDIG